ncbi:MAG: hypothetical protein ACLQOO_10505 [Terriglobia bacterium]
MSKLGQLISTGYRQALRLFHMLVGLVFLCLAVAGATVSFREWEEYRESASLGLARLYLFAGFTVLLILCGLYSFVKARSVR